MASSAVKPDIFVAILRFALEIAYNGTAYHGWQMQENSVSVQQVMEETLSTLLQQPIAVVGCGRTDTGVHASSYILHFPYDQELPDRFIFRINQMLPKDVAVYDAFRVKDDFHARFKATYRKYIYRTSFRKDPFQIDQCLHLWRKPDVDLMNKACAELLKQRDFAAFCKRGSDNKTTICELMECEWHLDGEQLDFHVKADRFLRNMVRALVGTLLDVGYGNIRVDDIDDIVASKDRSRAGKSVAARGLYLAEIGYDWNEYKIRE